MSDVTSDINDSQPASIAPTLQLSRRGLTLSLLAMVVAGLSVYALFPESVGGPELPVAVALDDQMVEMAGGGGAVLTEVVIVTNLTAHEIPRLSVEINGQYLLFREKPLAANESLTLPLRIFTDKRSSVRLDPDRYPVEEVVVTGQLPSGARGLSEFEIDPDDPSSISR